jgi:hypothetical protein
LSTKAMMIRFIAFVVSITGSAVLVHLHCPDFYTDAHVKSLTNQQLEDAFN